MIYVASPYRHSDNELVTKRVQLAEDYVAKLISEGKVAFSAVVYAHSLIKRHELPEDIQFWMKFLHAFIECSTEMHLLMLEGWDDSTGLKWETTTAKGLDIPITLVRG